ncbi:GtrA family protein [Shewanella waksmanii]|uniref:GtrA family protein n=1 Tax=Shewanella waksmanii TaxID=213783 RepID=UPI003735DBDD
MPRLTIAQIISQPVAKFLLVGGSAFLADMTLFLLLTYVIGMPLIAARIVAFLCALFMTWQLNRKWTFSARRQYSHKRQWMLVLLVALVAAGCNLAVFYALIHRFPVTVAFQILAMASGVLVGTAINWFGSNYVAFRDVTV